MLDVYNIEARINDVVQNGTLTIRNKYMVLAIDNKTRRIRYEELKGQEISNNQLLLYFKNGINLIINSEQIQDITHRIMINTLENDTKTESLSWFYLLIAFFYPIIGIIMWGVMYNKNPYNAKNIAKVSLAGSLTTIIFVLLFVLLNSFISIFIRSL